MSDDSFVREVNEAYRQEQYKRLWNRYGLYIVGGALLIVASVAGYKGWNYWQAKQAQDVGARFVGALTLEEDGNSGDARAAYEDIAAGGPEGYRILSRFQLAAAADKAGDREEAVKAYDALAADSSLDDVLRDYARIRAAVLLVDQAGLDDMKRRIGELAEGDGTWRNSAREMLGLAAYRNNDEAEAERYFQRVLVDPDVTANMRRRAEMMLALVVEAETAPATN